MFCSLLVATVVVGPAGGVISEVCAKQTVVGSDFATIRTHPTYVVRKSALYVHALAVSVRAILWASGSADSELRTYVHTYVRTYVEAPRGRTTSKQQARRETRNLF